MCIKYSSINSYNVSNQIIGKDFGMKLRDNKGVVGIDISVAVVILLILVPTIMGIVYNINSSKHSSKVKTEALNIAVNTIETAKGISLESLTNQELLSTLNSSNLYVMTVDNVTNSAIITTSIATYKLQVDVKDYKDLNNDEENDIIENIVKRIEVKVTYKIGDKEQTLELANVLK